MNRAYKLVWNHARNLWQCVAETATARGKRGGSQELDSIAITPPPVQFNSLILHTN